jgi:hypothetical protein
VYRFTGQHEHQTQGRGIVYRQTHRASSTPNTGKGYCVQTDSQSNMNTKPRGGVVCTDRLTEQHQHQTQGRGIVYRQTHRATSTPNTGKGYCVPTDSQSNMNTKPRGGVLYTDRLTEQHQHQTQGRGIVNRQTRRAT